ncbi:MAG: hypothetical protein IIZ51_08410 [Lachnospiraceae bacterium]|nr:hypothetical protein [Lachnospiraceae bacterium]
MLRSELVDRIVDMLDDDEWEELDEGVQEAEVSDFNRRILLSLSEGYGEFPGEVDDAEVEELQHAVKEHLFRVWAKAPESHRYVLMTCLARAFLYRRPLHPPELVRYYRYIRNGDPRYFCPKRDPEGGGLCRWCCAEPMDELEASWEKQISATRENEGETSALILSEAFRAGIMNAGIVRQEDIVYYQKVRDLCSPGACRYYGRTWSCPPAVGSLEECRKKVERYDKMLLISAPFMLADMMDFSEIDHTTRDFQLITLNLKRRLGSLVNDFYLLGNETCSLCEKCTWPEAPCRHPEDFRPSIEGFGFLIKELAEIAGIPYTNGRMTSTNFGAVFYNE